MEFHANNVLDYDKIPDLIDTKLFTELDGVEIIDECHPFTHFLRGFTFYLDNKICDKVLHGWYHKDTGTAKFLVRYPSDVGNIVTQAWRMFIGFDLTDVYIYSTYCGQIYESNEYETDKKTVYKEILKRLIDLVSSPMEN
jgi:hypothetical protein